MSSRNCERTKTASILTYCSFAAVSIFYSLYKKLHFEIFWFYQFKHNSPQSSSVLPPDCPTYNPMCLRREAREKSLGKFKQETTKPNCSCCIIHFNKNVSIFQDSLKHFRNNQKAQSMEMMLKGSTYIFKVVTRQELKNISFGVSIPRKKPCRYTYSPHCAHFGSLKKQCYAKFPLVGLY